MKSKNIIMLCAILSISSMAKGSERTAMWLANPGNVYKATLEMINESRPNFSAEESRQMSEPREINILKEKIRKEQDSVNNLTKTLSILPNGASAHHLFKPPYGFWKVAIPVDPGYGHRLGALVLTGENSYDSSDFRFNALEKYQAFYVSDEEYAKFDIKAFIQNRTNEHSLRKNETEQEIALLTQKLKEITQSYQMEKDDLQKKLDIEREDYNKRYNWQEISDVKTVFQKLFNATEVCAMDGQISPCDEAPIKVTPAEFRKKDLLYTEALALLHTLSPQTMEVVNSRISRLEAKEVL